MPSALETLVKILKLEQSTGYQDKAVIGGLKSFAAHWSSDAHTQAKKPEHHALVDELVGVIDNYAEQATVDARVDTIRYLLGRITGRIPSPAQANGAESNGGVITTSDQPVGPRDNGQQREPDRQPRQFDFSNRPPRYERQAQVERPPEHVPAGEPPSGVPVEPTTAALPVEAAPISASGGQEPPAVQIAPVEPLPFDRPAVPPAPTNGFSAVRRADVQPRPPRRRRDPSRAAQTAQSLRAPVTILDGVGPKNAEKLAELGLLTVEDVLTNYPRRYDDYTQMLPIARLKPGMTVTLIAEVRNVVVIKGKRGQDVLQVTVGDGTGTLTVSYFGATYLRSKFERGMQIVLRGKIDLFLGKLAMTHPDWEPLEREDLHKRAIVPVYSLTQQVPLSLVRRVTRSAVDSYASAMPDHMPDSVLDRMDLPDLGWALAQVHFPESWDALHLAQRRLSFDELILLQIGVLQNRREWQSQPALPISADDGWLEQAVGSLPFPLTGAQQRALQAIRADLAKSVPMNRLLQGDVGAGKTAVAALGMAMTVAGTGKPDGMQAAIMAPTGILAEQHYRSLTRMISAMPGGEAVNVQLLTSATPAQERAAILWGMGEGSVHIVVGTHALIQEDVHFWRLGLAIIDEQHRFGVEQRGKLRGKGLNPHVLVMTATPIPRTLALTLYADLDLTVLDEMPPGRSPVDTRVLLPRERQRAYGFINTQVTKGRQAFVVYPLVEASDSEAMTEVRSAVEEFERLSGETFPHLRLGLLHGKLSSAEKDAVMNAFSRNEIQVLVCTSVVEVGIDVPNATVMMIEGANRFGLAQLHQFRGRVGRSQHPSFCLLIPDDGDTDNERLKAMESTTDGFKLAELDWEMRGAGDLLGERQSGGTARLGEFMDSRLVQQAQIEARTLFEEDPALMSSEHQALREKVLARYGKQAADVS